MHSFKAICHSILSVTLARGKKKRKKGKRETKPEDKKEEKKRKRGRRAKAERTGGSGLMNYFDFILKVVSKNSPVTKTKY